MDSGQRAEIGDVARLDRNAQRRAATRPRATGGPELPFTGNGTFAVFASGLAALLIGALALWWGSRDRREIDAAGPEATG